jgi:hypothetical protein
MATIRIKLPADTHVELTRRAVAAGQSLQEYLRTRLIDEASRPTLEEVLGRIGTGDRTGGRAPVDELVAGLRADRAGH